MIDMAARICPVLSKSIQSELLQGGHPVDLVMLMATDRMIFVENKYSKTQDKKRASGISIL